jgi:hypothetical protein
VKRLFNPHWGKKVQRDAIAKIAAVLELQPIDFIGNWLPPVNSSQQRPINMNEVDWQEVALVVLARQQKERQLRQKATEQGFEINVFVPLRLVERKQALGWPRSRARTPSRCRS